MINTSLTNNQVRLRTQAAKAYEDISFREHIGQPVGPQEYKDAYEGLILDSSGDSSAISLDKTLAPLETWAGDNPERQSTVYSTALRVAGQAIGGAPGAALEGFTEYPMLGALKSLAGEAGEAAIPFLENLVPEDWADGEGTASQWRVGQSLNMIREGRPDNVRNVGSTWLSHKEGQKLTAAEVDATVEQIADFKSEKLDEGWKRPIVGLKRMEGETITFLAAVDGELESFEGVIENPRGALFKLEGQDRQFNANSCHSMVQADSPNLRYYESLSPEELLRIQMFG